MSEIDSRSLTDWSMPLKIAYLSVSYSPNKKHVSILSIWNSANDSQASLILFDLGSGSFDPKYFRQFISSLTDDHLYFKLSILELPLVILYLFRFIFRIKCLKILSSLLLIENTVKLDCRYINSIY